MWLHVNLARLESYSILMRLHTSPQYDTLVEHRSTFGAEQAELNVFATREVAHRFSLRFDAPVVATMLSGKKVMRLNGGDDFDFLPGESALLTSGTQMSIDFPIATIERPTRCLALALAPELITSVSENLNHRLPLPDGGIWDFRPDDTKFRHTPGVQAAIERIIAAFIEDHPGRDLFVQHALEELIVRVVQRRSMEEAGTESGSSERLNTVVRYVKSNLQKQLDVTRLSKLACMSESHFHRSFKLAFGESPSAYIKRERIGKAAELLAQAEASVSQISEQVGFRSVAHFSRSFKEIRGVSPSQWAIVK